MWDIHVSRHSVKEKETEAGLKVNILQAIAKRLETQAVFQVISDILIVSKHFTPFLPYQCCYGFSKYYDIQSNKQQHWKGEGGLEMYLSCPFAFRSALLDGNPFFSRVYQQFCNFTTACRYTVTIVI